MTMKKKFGMGFLLFAMALVSIALVPAVSAQENDYSITAEKAFEHANAHMINFITADAPNFEN